MKIPPRPRRRGWTTEFRNQVLVVAAFVAFLVVLGGIIGFAFLQDYWEENVSLPNSTALQVGDTTFDLDYFAHRMEPYARQIGAQGQVDFSQLNAIVGVIVGVLEQEELLRQRAGPDLGISVSTAEIEQQIADGLGASLDNRELFDQLYQAEVQRSGLSDQEFWEMTRASVLSQKVALAFNNAVPGTLEQVNLRLIRVATEDEAGAVRERLEAGEDFGEVARELSLDEATKEAGGELGWLAHDELDLSYGDKVFALEAGTVSEPVETADGFFIFEVMEKDPAREVSETQRSAIGGGYYSLWVDEQRTLLPTVDFVRSDPDKLRWAVEKAFGL